MFKAIQLHDFNKCNLCEKVLEAILSFRLTISESRNIYMKSNNVWLTSRSGCILLCKRRKDIQGLVKDLLH